MAKKTQTLAVGSTMVTIPRQLPDGYSKLKISNYGNYDVYIGDTDLVAASGFPIFAQTSEDFELGIGDSLYVVGNVGEPGTLRIMESR